MHGDYALEHNFPSPPKQCSVITCKNASTTEIVRYAWPFELTFKMCDKHKDPADHMVGVAFPRI